MSDYISYSKRFPECRDFTFEEWRFVNTYTYDTENEFNDLRIFTMQNNYRFSYMWDELGIPPDSSSFCTAFNKNKERTRLIQRHLCSKQCFWNPQDCFLSDCHSGNLEDIMHKDFHEKFNPEFQEQFNRNFTDKIDWAPTGGPGIHYPSVGVNKLIEEMGITTKLDYDDGKYAINFNNLSKDLRNSIPDRPTYVIEVKRCHDVVEALLNINRQKIAENKNKMRKIYDESFKGNGQMSEPILSLMMWGPLTNYKLKKMDKECQYDTLVDSQLGVHVCSNFSEKNYWMFTHSANYECVKGIIDKLEGPVMTSDLKFVYPCNRSGCNHNCMCELCINCYRCPKDEHKKHIEMRQTECPVEKDSQCPEHEIDHPKNFNDKEDLLVHKNIFYHNLELEEKPRRHSAENIIFAGVKKSCTLCCSTIKDHFKHHKIVHLNCKYCAYQLRTSFDEKFWDKVCHVCGKIFSSIESLEHWHRRSHTSDWNCYECDISFTRKWTLKRHLKEIHNIEYESDDESSSGEDDVVDEPLSSDEGTEIEDSDFEVDEDKGENSILKCKFCDKQFSVQRYLDTHVMVKHTKTETFQCENCDKTFHQKKHLKRHRETIHGLQNPDIINFKSSPKNHICNICGSIFNRADNLTRHMKSAHVPKVKDFACMYCEKKFDKKWNLSRHEKSCSSKPK